ncbi:MAG: Holliday junction resolvase RuvX [Acidobacteriota bacterium]|nr:Holliday junction resolvase RuvX [Acidobacteriota bacterium]
MKVLAVDYGSRRTGLAVGDTLTRVSTPLPLIASGNPRAVVAEIRKRAAEFEAGLIVVGYPLNMDGTPGPACAAVDRFVAFLRRRIALPVTLVDEKLSSFAAEEMGKEFENDFRKRRKFLDSVAAQVILQDYLSQP